MNLTKFEKTIVLQKYFSKLTEEFQKRISENLTSKIQNNLYGGM